MLIQHRRRCRCLSHCCLMKWPSPMPFDLYNFSFPFFFLLQWVSSVTYEHGMRCDGCNIKSNVLCVMPYRRCRCCGAAAAAVVVAHYDSPPSSSLARKKKSCKTKALHHVFTWCKDTLIPENEENSMSLFWKNAILSFLPYKASSRVKDKITKGSTLYIEGIQVLPIFFASP